MIHALRETGKRTAGWLLSRSAPGLDYRNCLFVLAHMRCGSTALSNILCSRPDVSGYGESHVRHDGQGALGRLAMNQMRRGGWKPQAPILFDKILHSRHDWAAPQAFFDARAVFMVRRPGDAICSIVRLFSTLGRDEYASEQDAAIYYVERLTALAALWDRFPPHRRVGITHEALMGAPDTALGKISTGLNFAPSLENRYVSLAASRRGGGGDPIVSGRYNCIQVLLDKNGRPDANPDIPSVLMADARARYERLVERFEMSDSCERV